MGEKTAIRGSEVSRPESHSGQVTELEFKPWSVTPELSPKPCLTGLVKSNRREGRSEYRLRGLDHSSSIY